MATPDGRLNFDTKIDTKGFSKDANSLGKQLDSLKSTVTKLGAAIGVAFSVKALVDFGKQAVDIASDMQEVQNVVDTAFDDMSYKMEEFADKAIESYGISKLTAKQTGSTFAAMASGMQLPLDAATDMAVTLTGLSADMASFYNVEQDVSATALKSVFTGETETLKQFGIVMNQTNLEAYALSQGITKSYQAMTEAERVQLRYGFVMQSTALAQGDFAKTAGGWANQTRMLSENWKEFSSVIGSVLVGIMLPAVKSLNSALASLTSYARGTAEALSNLFGIEPETGNTASQLGSSAASAAESYDDMASAAEAAATANEKSLAGFDKVNKLSDNSDAGAGSGGASAGSSVTTLGGLSTIKVDADTSSAEGKLGGLRSIFSSLVEPFVSAWENRGQGTIDSIKYSFGEIAGLAGEIGSSFVEVWSNGTGQTSLEHILGIITNINNATGNLTRNFKNAWAEGDLGTTIVQNVADAFNTLLDHAENTSERISSWADTLDFTPILTSVKNLTSAFEPLADNIGESLEWLFENVLLPLGSWTIEDAAPAAVDALASALDSVNSAIDYLKPLGEWLWDDFLQPVASWTGGAIVNALEDLGDGLKTISDLLSGKLSFKDFIKDLNGAQVVIGSVATAIGILLGAKAIGGLITKMPVLLAQIGAQTAALIANATAWVAANAPILAVAAGIAAVIAIGVTLYQHWGEIKDFALQVWENIKEVLYSFFDFWRTGFDGLVESGQNAVSNIKSFFADIGQWFADRAAAIKNAFVGIGEWFGGIFEKGWANIQSAFSSAAAWAISLVAKIKLPFLRIADWFREKFSAAWTAVKNVFSSGGEIFSGIKEGILSGFKSVVNALIDGINTVVAIPFDGINTALKKIRDLDILGVEPFGWIKTIDVPQIPKLATGTVVPANYGEFLAMLGDNKRETEVVSPLSTIEQAVTNAMRKNSSDQGGDIHITIELDGNVIYKTVVKKNNENTIRTGKNALAT